MRNQVKIKDSLGLNPDPFSFKPSSAFIQSIPVNKAFNCAVDLNLRASAFEQPLKSQIKRHFCSNRDLVENLRYIF